MNITKEQLLEIGRDIAAGWGGECYDIEVLKAKRDIIYRFQCVEHGEFFYTDLTEDEIKEELNKGGI